MKSISELQIASVKYKRQIWRHFHNNKKQLSRFLQDYSTPELNAILLLSIDHPAELCSFLDTSFQDLEQIMNQPYYSCFRINKKKGGKREICAPDNQLKILQKKLNYYLQAVYLSVRPTEVHGFIINSGEQGKQCNIVANAIVHTRKKYVLNIDLKDFFSNISGKQVLDVFSSDLFQFNEQIAQAITLLTTYEGRLPTGAPTSPVISNFVCLNLDQLIRKYCARNSLTYTRYADDLTISSDAAFSESLMDEIKAIIKHCGFIINEKKVRITTANKQQTVTGIIVNEKVNADRRMIRKIRAMIFDLKTNGLEVATRKHFQLIGVVDKKYSLKYISRIDGYINFIGQVRGKSDNIYLKLKTAFAHFFRPDKQVDLAQLEFKIDYFNRTYKNNDAINDAINAYFSENHLAASSYIEDYKSCNRFLSYEIEEIIQALTYLLEYKKPRHS